MVKFGMEIILILEIFIGNLLPKIFFWGKGTSHSLLPPTYNSHPLLPLNWGWGGRTNKWNEERLMDRTEHTMIVPFIVLDIFSDFKIYLSPLNRVFWSLPMVAGIQLPWGYCYRQSWPQHTWTRSRPPASSRRPIGQGAGHSSCPCCGWGPEHPLLCRRWASARRGRPRAWPSPSCSSPASLGMGEVDSQ